MLCQGCGDYTCLCTEQINQGMVSCMNCVLTTTGPPDAETANAIQLALSGNSFQSTTILQDPDIVPVSSKNSRMPANLLESH